MRLGVSLGMTNDDPEEQALTYIRAGYAAAVCPPVSLERPEQMRAVRESFTRHDVMLAEIGVWNNMLAPDPVQREANLEANIQIDE